MNEYKDVEGEKLVFDHNENLVKDDRFEYFYDYGNRLWKVVNPDTQKQLDDLDRIEYDYDVLGRIRFRLYGCLYLKSRENRV